MVQVVERIPQTGPVNPSAPGAALQSLRASPGLIQFAHKPSVGTPKSKRESERVTLSFFSFCQLSLMYCCQHSLVYISNYIIYTHACTQEHTSNGHMCTAALLLVIVGTKNWGTNFRLPKCKKNKIIIIIKIYIIYYLYVIFDWWDELLDYFYEWFLYTVVLNTKS